MHMLTKPQVFYDECHKTALGYQTPIYLTQAQIKVPTLCCGNTIVKQHDALSVIDSEETLELVKEKQTFWLPISKPVSKIPSVQPEPVLKEIPRELLTICLVKDSFNKIRNHVNDFENVVTVRTKVTGQNEGSWGFKDIRKAFDKDVKPFVKTLKDYFHMFDQGLHKEITNMKEVCTQMETEVAKCFVERKSFEIKEKALLLENDRILELIISQDLCILLALLAKSKRFFKKRSQRLSSAKATKDTQCHKCGRNGHFARDCFSKTSVPSFPSPNQNHTQHRLSSSSLHKTKSKDFKAKYNKVKAKLALLSPDASASKSILVKNKGLIAETSEWDEKDVSCDDNEVMEVKALMALAEEESVPVYKECARDREWVQISIRKHPSTEILKENKNLRKELNGLKSTTKTWLNSSKQVNQYISEQIPAQKKRIMGVGQLTEDPSSSGLKDLVFIKSSVDNTKASIPCVERPWLSEVEVAVIDSSETEYDSADESSVCSTFFSLLEKLGDAKSVSGPKAVKKTLMSISTFKARALKFNSAPAENSKNVKSTDYLHLATVIKELNDL
ncbi:retrovirus-related pol polyprotein from transposon TNT 1-94 [Tanacetum coccineum]